MLAGRAGVIAALLVFITTYAYGLLAFGPLLGIGLGWLPCGIAAWLTAIVVAFTVHHVPPRLIASGMQLASFARIIALRIQHRH